MSELVYIIEEAWCDNLENEMSEAFGYAPIGFVVGRDKADQIVADGGLLPPGWAWCVQTETPRFRYKELPLIEPGDPRLAQGKRGS